MHSNQPWDPHSTFNLFFFRLKRLTPKVNWLQEPRSSLAASYVTCACASTKWVTPLITCMISNGKKIKFVGLILERNSAEVRDWSHTLWEIFTAGHKKSIIPPLNTSADQVERGVLMQNVSPVCIQPVVTPSQHSC